MPHPRGRRSQTQSTASRILSRPPGLTSGHQSPTQVHFMDPHNMPGAPQAPTNPFTNPEEFQTAAPGAFSPAPEESPADYNGLVSAFGQMMTDRYGQLPQQLADILNGQQQAQQPTPTDLVPTPAPPVVPEVPQAAPAPEMAAQTIAPALPPAPNPANIQGLRNRNIPGFAAINRFTNPANRILARR